MEEKRNEEIIAYRIGESLFCPDCHEKAVKDLEAAQAPNEPEVTFPSKAIKVGDIKIFICQQCKTIKGSDRVTAEKVEIPQRKSLTDLLDMIDDSVSKLYFIEDFFCHSIPEDEFFSEKGKTGLYRILVDLEDDLTFVSNGISQMHQKDLIIEKREQG